MLEDEAELSTADIEKIISQLEEEIEYHQLQGCGYAIANWLLPELQRHKDMLK